MNSTTFSRDVNRKINLFLSRVKYNQLRNESDVVLLLGEYLQKSGYDVLLNYELNSLISLKNLALPSVRKVDIMVKDAYADDFFPIEVKYYRGINLTHQHRRDLIESYSVIQAMLHTYGVMGGGSTICITDNPYLSGDVRTARQLNLVRKRGAKILQVPSGKRRNPTVAQKGIDWKEVSNESNMKYTSIKSEQISDLREDSLDNADEVICSWHEQYEKSRNGEHVEL